MTRQEVQRLLPSIDVVLCSGPNWTAVWFFAGLALLHAFVATAAFWNRHWEGFMSLVFAGTFAAIAIGCAMVRTEMTVDAVGRRLRIRCGTRHIYSERLVPFQQIQSVRLTLLRPRQPSSARIELVCQHEVIECPPSQVPRAEALCLAVTMGARLIKVYGNAFEQGADRMQRLNFD